VADRDGYFAPLGRYSKGIKDHDMQTFRYKMKKLENIQPLFSILLLAYIWATRRRGLFPEDGSYFPNGLTSGYRGIQEFPE
jgi:hypothetical protein